MDSQVASTMRYYEHIYERYLSKLPVETGDPSKLTNKGIKSRAKNGYIWSNEDIETMREMRLQGVSFRQIGRHFNMSACAIQRLADMHKMYSPTSVKKNLMQDHE